MKRRWIAIIAVLAIGVIVCGVNWGLTRADLSDTQSQLQATEAELADTQAERGALATELANTQAELEATQTELANTQAELEATQDELSMQILQTIYWIDMYYDAAQEADYWESLYYSVEHPSNFDSLSELEAWLAEDDTDSYIYIPDTFDCDDFALTLSEHAREDGYIIYFQIVDFELVYDEDASGWYIEEGYYPYYYHEFDFWTDEDLGGVGQPDHAMNVAVIGNDVYLVESQTDNVWLWCCLD